MRKHSTINLHLLKSFIISLVILLILTLLTIFNVYIINKDLITGIITVSGVFIGFSITAIALFCTIPFRVEINERLKESGYMKQVPLNFFISMVSFVISLIIALLFFTITIENAYFIQHILTCLSLISFTFGLSLLIFTTYNLYIIITKNNIVS